MTRVAVVGAGGLGSKIGFLLAQRRVCGEVVLVDVVADHATGHALDISQSVAMLNDVSVSAGGFSDVSGADVVVITAGKPRTPDMKDRLDLARVNSAIVSDVCVNVRKYAPDAIVIVCSNPMDVMNLVAFNVLGFDASRVIGMGGRLDSARFRTVIADALNVRACDVDAYVVGEHGEGMVPVFSHVKVGGKIRKFSAAEKEKITGLVRGMASRVIGLKGLTDFGPAACVCDMVSAVLSDSGLVTPCSVFLPEYGVSIGVPVRIDGSGAHPVERKFSVSERDEFMICVAKLKGIVSALGI